MRNTLAYTLVTSICIEHQPELSWFRVLFHWLFKISPIEYSYVVTVTTPDKGNVVPGCTVLMDASEIPLFVSRVERFDSHDKLTLSTISNLRTPLEFTHDGSLVVFGYAYTEKTKTT